MDEMAAGHSVDDYLETIYFLAFPIGEYRPDTKGSPTLAVRVADMLGVSRASAGEMLKRLEADGLARLGSTQSRSYAGLTNSPPAAFSPIARSSSFSVIVNWPAAGCADVTLTFAPGTSPWS